MESNATAASIKEILTDLPYLDMGAGFTIGLVLGYFLKKSLKVLMLLAGAIVALLFGLEQIDIVHIDQSQLQHTVAEGTGWFKSALVYMKERVSRFGTAGSGSAVAGFLVGLKMG